MTDSHNMTINFDQERQSSFKERVKQEREQEILEAARDVFAERGFEKANIDEIAERVGIGKGTVYLHFASKEELLIALMRQACGHLVETIQAQVAEQPTALDKLHAVVRALAEHRYANDRWVRVVATELPVFFGYKQKMGASAELRALVAGIVEQGQAEGSIDARIRPPLAAMTLMFLIFAAPSAITDEQLSKQQLIETASQICFHGITKEVVE
jgi:AcrR family transcriptional regulator